MSGNEIKPTDSPQDSHHVGQEQHHHGGTQPMERALSPDLQEMIDQAEKDRELYEDSWTNPRYVYEAPYSALSCYILCVLY